MTHGWSARLLGRGPRSHKANSPGPSQGRPTTLASAWARTVTGKARGRKGSRTEARATTQTVGSMRTPPGHRAGARALPAPVADVADGHRHPDRPRDKEGLGLDVGRDPGRGVGDGRLGQDDHPPFGQEHVVEILRPDQGPGVRRRGDLGSGHEQDPGVDGEGGRRR